MDVLILFPQLNLDGCHWNPSKLTTTAPMHGQQNFFGGVARVLNVCISKLTLLTSGNSL